VTLTAQTIGYKIALCDVGPIFTYMTGEFIHLNETLYTNWKKMGKPKGAIGEYYPNSQSAANGIIEIVELTLGSDINS